MLECHVVVPHNVRAPWSSVVYVQPKDLSIMKGKQWCSETLSFDGYVQMILAAMARQASPNTVVRIHPDNK